MANLDEIADTEIDREVEVLKNRPSRCLGYRTPAEVFAVREKCLASD